MLATIAATNVVGEDNSAKETDGAPWLESSQLGRISDRVIGCCGRRAGG